MEERIRLYLGIDGGGTKTAVTIITDTRAVVGEGTGGPGNIAVTAEPVLRRSVLEGVSQACAIAGLEIADTHFAGVCAAMAGYSDEERRQRFFELLKGLVKADRYRIEPDYVAAYWGATLGEPGIVVIAGTGAVAYGRNAEGESYREDGLGYLLGDRGSGFNLGLHALRYTLDRMKEGNVDRLAAAVLEFTGAQSQSGIVRWLYGDFVPAKVAELAPVVGALADEGDRAARDLVAKMARCLRHSVRQVRHKLWLPRDVPVYMLGGLWNIGSFFRSEFIQPTWRVEGEGDDLSGGRFLIGTPHADAAYGAALLALEASLTGS